MPESEPTAETAPEPGKPTRSELVHQLDALVKAIKHTPHELDALHLNALTSHLTHARRILKR